MTQLPDFPIGTTHIVIAGTNIIIIQEDAFIDISDSLESLVIRDNFYLQTIKDGAFRELRSLLVIKTSNSG